MDVEGDFHDYRGGIFRSDSCWKDSNHAMLAVGYGEDEYGNFYIHTVSQKYYTFLPGATWEGVIFWDALYNDILYFWT